MIKQIKLKNYILIDELTVDFDKGLNVITGETGSGKSILINAIDIAFSNRVSKEVIKTGEEKASIELLLISDKPEIRPLFEEYGIDFTGDEILLTKDITQNAVRTRINGTPVNSDCVRQLKEMFLDIHSQHQTYAFMQPKFHITLLDNYGKDVYSQALSEYRELFANYKNMQKLLEELQNASDATDSQIDFLKFQLDEIDGAEIKSSTEDEELEKELTVLENAEKLKELTGVAYWSINGDDGSVLEGLSGIKQNLSKAASMDESLSEREERLVDIIESLKDLSSELRDYNQSLDNDTERLNEIQERLYTFDKLKRKYGATLEEVLESRNKFEAELNSIENSTKNLEELSAEILKTEARLTEMAQNISENRQNYARVLSTLVEEKLYQLELPKAQFKINLERKVLSPDGIDNVEFLISTNVSEGLKPLAKIASGGEISRVMLAIKSIFAQSDDIDTVIFDEIDTGISGKASQSVADEIKELAKYRQIIVITHQAIIASKADRHFYVAKSQEAETKVNVYVLDDEYRVKALAELAGGEINSQSIEFAKSLLAM